MCVAGAIMRTAVVIVLAPASARLSRVKFAQRRSAALADQAAS
jgi:hypothetical protein